MLDQLLISVVFSANKGSESSLATYSMVPHGNYCFEVGYVDDFDHKQIQQQDR